MKKLTIMGIGITLVLIGTSINAKRILVLSAMQVEANPVVAQMHDVHSANYNNIDYKEGVIGNNTVYSAVTGIGAVNAAVVSSQLITSLYPDAVIFSGVAGGLQPYAKYGDVLVANKIRSTDYNLASISTLPPNPMRKQQRPAVFKADPYLLELAHKVKSKKSSSVHFGTIDTDQHFPDRKATVKLLQHDGVAAIAMEDTGIAEACWLYNTPFLVIRSMSDNQTIKYTQHRAAIAAKQAAAFTASLIKHMA